MIGWPDIAGMPAGRPVDARTRRADWERILRAGPPWNKGHAVSLTGLGLLVWQDDGDPERALGYLEPAIEADPLLPEAALLASGVLSELGRWDRALAVVETALERMPGHRGLADRVSSLLFGAERWEEGWRIWPVALAEGERRLAVWLRGIPRWDGSPLAGRTLSVWPHPRCAGDGDLIWISRYVPRIEGGGVLMIAPTPLHRLLEHSLPGVRAVLPADASGADLWCLSAELPLLLSGMAGPPPSAPYITAPPDDVERWRDRLRIGSVRRLVVGLVWQAGHKDDLPRGVTRSIPSAALAPLGRPMGIRWLSLQQGPGWNDPVDWKLGLARPVLRSYADTAAVVAHLDLTITCDTSVANLAGSMGVPCWVLLPTASDWRWGRGDVSAWYPTARLFRQQRPGDWTSVVNEVAEALRQRVKRHRR